MNYKTTFFVLGIALCCSLPGFGEINQSAARTSGGLYSESPLRGSIDIRYAPTRFPRYNWGPNASPTDPKTHGIRISTAFIPYHDDAGKLGLGLDFGFYFASGVDLGQGRVANLEVFPLGLNVNYHFDFMKNQILVPFAKIGPEVLFVNQTSKTGGGVRGTQAFYGLNYSVGFQFCLNTLDPGSARTLDTSTGINNVYLTVEYAWTQHLAQAKNPDMTRNEWLMGIRAEI